MDRCAGPRLSLADRRGDRLAHGAAQPLHRRWFPLGACRREVRFGRRMTRCHAALIRRAGKLLIAVSGAVA
jgi:hypothetical protein